MIETIDLSLRAAFLGIMGLLSLHFVMLRPVCCKSMSALILAVTSGLLVLAFYPAHPNPDPFVHFTQTLIIAASPALITWGLFEIFEDDFKIETWHIAFVALAFPTHFLTDFHPIFDTVCHWTSLAIYGYLFYRTILTAKHDLVEARLKFRVWFMASAAIVGGSLTFLHSIYGEKLPEPFMIYKSASMFLLAIIFAYYALRVREHVWATPTTRQLKQPEDLSPAEIALMQKLNSSMQEDVWRKEGLTIRKLAELLDAPEHRLRKVINRGLGYRNFAAFVNEHRIEAACEALADPVSADVPIINIAYDVGYASLGPFNRAFREIVGESPTEYRKRSFAHA